MSLLHFPVKADLPWRHQLEVPPGSAPTLTWELALGATLQRSFLGNEEDVIEVLTQRWGTLKMLVVYLNSKHGARDCGKLTVLQVVLGHQTQQGPLFSERYPFTSPHLHLDQLHIPARRTLSSPFFPIPAPLSSRSCKGTFPFQPGQHRFAKSGSCLERNA